MIEPKKKVNSASSEREDFGQFEKLDRGEEGEATWNRRKRKVKSKEKGRCNKNSIMTGKKRRWGPRT